MEWIVEFLDPLSRMQVVHYGFLFLLAAFIHARQVRREIALQFTMVSAALNNVAKALTEDLAQHSERLDKIEKDVTIIKGALKSKE